MSYRVEDNDTRTITSSFGVLNGNDDSHVRSFIPQVRVGSMALDNYKNDNSGGRQQGATLPFDDNATDGITTNFWQATMAAYDGAVEAYEDAKSKAATSAADEDKAPCFSKAPPNATTKGRSTHPQQSSTTSNGQRSSMPSAPCSRLILPCRTERQH